LCSRRTVFAYATMSRMAGQFASDSR